MIGFYLVYSIARSVKLAVINWLLSTAGFFASAQKEKQGRRGCIANRDWLMILIINNYNNTYQL